VTVAVLARDLMVATRIADAGARAGVDVVRCDDAHQLPPPTGVRVLFVDWSDRRPDWGERLAAWRGDAEVRIVLFGPHTDLAAHADARAAGLGPMLARSKLIGELPTLVATSL
jgi:hypothetical protein